MPGEMDILLKPHIVIAQIMQFRSEEVGNYWQWMPGQSHSQRNMDRVWIDETVIFSVCIGYSSLSCGLVSTIDLFTYRCIKKWTFFAEDAFSMIRIICSEYMTLLKSVFFSVSGAFEFCRGSDPSGHAKFTKLRPATGWLKCNQLPWILL